MIEPKLKGKETRDYFETFDRDFDGQLIKNKAEDILIIHDPKDKIIPKTQATKLAKIYDAPLLTPTSSGNHFTDEQEPELLASMTEFFTKQLQSVPSSS